MSHKRETKWKIKPGNPLPFPSCELAIKWKSPIAMTNLYSSAFCYGQSKYYRGKTGIYLHFFLQSRCHSRNVINIIFNWLTPYFDLICRMCEAVMLTHQRLTNSLDYKGVVKPACLWFKIFLRTQCDPFEEISLKTF